MKHDALAEESSMHDRQPGINHRNFEKHPLKFSRVSLALWNVTPQFDSSVEYGR